MPGTQIDRSGQLDEAQVVPEMRLDVIDHRPKLRTRKPVLHRLRAAAFDRVTSCNISGQCQRKRFAVKRPRRATCRGFRHHVAHDGYDVRVIDVELSIERLVAWPRVARKQSLQTRGVQLRYDEAMNATRNMDVRLVAPPGEDKNASRVYDAMCGASASGHANDRGAGRTHAHVSAVPEPADLFQSP